MNRDRIRCFKCGEYDHFVNECLNLIPKDSDRESDGTRSVSLHLADSGHRFGYGTIFKHMKGRNGSTSFLPLKKRGGLQGKIPSELCLTKQQAKQVYDKKESGEEVKIRKIIQQNTSISPKQVTSRNDVNHYEKALFSDKNMIKSNSQMETVVNTE